MLKIGMIGAGFVAEFHRKSLQSVRGVELASVYALKGAEELAQRAREAGLGDTQVASSVAELCENADVVCIFVPNFVRLAVLKEIVAAARQEAEAEKTRIIAEADAEAATLRDQAIAEIEAAHRQAADELNSQIDQQVTMATEHVLGRD